MVDRLGGREGAARQVWTFKRVAPEALGGQRSPSAVVGHLCLECSEAAKAAGALGPSAVLRSLVGLVASDLVPRLAADPYRLRLDGLLAWGALVAEALRRVPPSPPPPPNRTRWAHVGDLDRMADRIRSALRAG